MNLPNQIVITLKAKHFKETEFALGGDCAIEKAVKERFSVPYLNPLPFLKQFIHDHQTPIQHV